ncbi:MAG: lipoate protein ligase C-terminal domain-containing protein [Candidatus Thorarchaeota archaeon]
MSYYSYKVPGGKLIKIDVRIKDATIEAITILGDFFLHPEEVLDELEEGLRGVQLSESHITKSIQDVLDRNECTLIGAAASDFAQAIIEASQWTPE